MLCRAEGSEGVAQFASCGNEQNAVPSPKSQPSWDEVT